MSNYLFDALLPMTVDTGEAVFAAMADGTTLSYAEVDARTAQWAQVLVAAGVQPGDRVAAQVEKSVEALLLYLASLRCGAVFLALNPAYTTTEVAYFLGDATPTVFVCDPALVARLTPVAVAAGVSQVLTLSAAGSGSLLEQAQSYGTVFAPLARQADDLAALLYTSGTTGRSKGAMLTHGNLLSNARTLGAAWRFTAADRLLHALPVYHTHGLFVATNVTLLARASLWLLPRFELPEVLRLLPQSTVMMGVPTFYTRLLACAEFRRETAASVRVFISGSAPLTATTHREFSARTGQAILERYGMTETNMITSNPYAGPRVPGSVGPALPEVEVRICAEDGSVVLPAGDVGVIEVRGPNVFPGYWRQPDKTAVEFRSDGFFITGDLGRLDAAGYVHIVGRAKDLVISGGLNVYPAEVEAALDALPGVAESAVIGLPHDDLGEVVVAVVVPRAGVVLEPDTLLHALATTLARYKQPRQIFLVAELPRNAMGKVQKNRLREQYA